jgi:hypothetical protein
MKIEALCESRDPDRPAANEDCLVVAPGRGLAVFDGVTDRTGLRFEGQTSGRIASRAAADAFSAFLADGGGSADLLVARAMPALVFSTTPASRRGGVSVRRLPPPGGAAPIGHLRAWATAASG